MQKVSRERFEWLKQKHYELWDWLSRNPEKSKEDWFKLDKNRGLRIKNNCFACHFDMEAGDKPCTRCPIFAECLGGLYNEYCTTKNNYNSAPENNTILRLRTKVIELAQQIRGLPWSEEYVEDEKMNNENYIIINGKKAELTKEQLKQLGIEADKKDKRWRAEEGGKFFFVDRNCIDSRFDIRCVLDNYSYDTHNYFQTEEEAKEYAEVLEIKRQLMKFADEYNGEVDWNKTNQFGYVIYWNSHLNEVRISQHGLKTNPETICFSSDEIAKQAINAIGKENLRKYLTYNY